MAGRRASMTTAREEFAAVRGVLAGLAYGAAAWLALIGLIWITWPRR